VSELKPCPFCGEEAVYDIHEESNGQYIRCSRCNASTALFYDRAENLLASWNTRTTPKITPEMLQQAEDYAWDQVQPEKDGVRDFQKIHGAVVDKLNEMLGGE